MTNVDWVFVKASALVGALGDSAKRADTWWPFIASNRQTASATRGVLVGVTTRNEYMPLLQIAFTEKGSVADYNPDGLKSGALSLLVPLSVSAQVDRHIEDMAEAASLETIRLARIKIEADLWEAGHEAREAAALLKVRIRKDLIAPLEVMATRYRLTEADLLSADDSPTWVYHTLKSILVDESFDHDELLRLRESSFKYLAAAVHWRAWETAADPWNVVHTCSLLRRAGEPRKAVKLLSKVETANWNASAVSAFLTTLGGAERDAGSLQKAWDSAQAAVLIRDDKPHPYLLLGALCYQQSRHAEGDIHFAKARARGATDKDIEFTRREAESRRRNAANEDHAEDL